RTGVENSRSEGALLAWEPLCHGFDGRGEVARLAQSESESRNTKTEHRRGERVTDRRHTPDSEHHGITEARTNAVDEASGDQESDGVCRLKRRDDPAVLNFAPADDFL